MRRVRYSVAMTLDGYIAGPKGESDWITMDPEIDFAAFASSFDTILSGRKTTRRRDSKVTWKSDLKQRFAENLGKLAELAPNSA